MFSGEKGKELVDTLIKSSKNAATQEITPASTQAPQSEETAKIKVRYYSNFIFVF